MAEVKNAFIKSKMNLDLDARLLPKGEYREGNNIQVSKSESADVGALENVLGNQILADFNSLASLSTLQVIGQFTNTNDNVIYVFLTDYTEPNPSTNITYSSAANNYIYAFNVVNSSAQLLVNGAWLNFSTTNLITGINLLENLLFFTDNRNQPRKINVRLASENTNYYTNEDQISVAKYVPFQPINLYKLSTAAPSSESSPYLTGYETTMYDVVSPTLSNNTTQNPYFQGSSAPYNSTYPGDPDYLESRFVRFSYRFRYDDNEYSSFAPFTQAAFIPKQDGYFLSGDEEKSYISTIVNFMENKVNEIKLQIPLPLDNVNTAVTGDNLFSYFKIKEIEILYKEDDNNNVQVLDSIQQADFGTSNVIEYTYQSTKPYKTLPESQLVRVFDKVPVRALSQEIISNRVVYGNFQDKHTPPPSLDYNVGVTQKTAFALPGAAVNNPVGNTSITEYPNSTVKQNRNYQIGVVLSDRYGRSSTVLLSKNQAQQILDDNAFDAATVYHNYRTTFDATEIPITALSGDSIKILFNQEISSDNSLLLTSGQPGLYDGNTGTSSYNPLGWYSFKLVVKQSEQEYYNVYTAGILDGPPNGVTATNDTPGEDGFMSLFSDNINKIPRDLNAVGPDQKQFRSSSEGFSEDLEEVQTSRSSVELFGRVTPQNSSTPGYNTSFYPNTSTLTSVDNNVAIIGTVIDMFGLTTASDATELYNSSSNPLVAKFTQIASNAIGSLSSSASSYNFQLGVFETSPVESLLNIYYETSTTGLISALNAAILAGNSGLATGFFRYSFALNEGMAIDTVVADQFGVESADSAAQLGGSEPVQVSNLTIVAIRNGNNEIIQEGDNGPYFTMTKSTNNGQTLDKNDPTTYDNYTIKTARLFYYGPNSGVVDQYQFTYDNDGTELTSTGSLANVAPTISPKPASIPTSAGQTTLNSGNSLFDSVNGSADTQTLVGESTAVNKKDLEYSITSQPTGDPFSIDSVSGEITITGTPAGINNVTIQVKDAGALTDSFTTEIIFGEAAVNPGWGRGANIAQESLLAAGGSSLAVYWTSDATNAVNTGASVAPILDRTMDSWSPGGSTNLVLNSTLPTTGNYIETKNISTSIGGIYYEFQNSNYNAIGSATVSGLSQSDGGLTRGAGYVCVDISMDNDAISETYSENLSQSELMKVQFPIALQYRPLGAAADAWEIATDIEGNEVRWGSTTLNQYQDYNVYPINGNEGLSYEGRLEEANTARAGFGSRVNDPSSTNSSNQTDYIELNVDTLSQNNQDYIAVQGKKLFCVGMAQTRNGTTIYSDATDKFGDYRLVIRYPYGQGNQSFTNIPIVPGWPDSSIGGGQLPNNTYANSPFFIYNIDWGDMYYPYLRTNPSITSYAYQVTTAGANDAAAATQLALSGGKVTVWAREPFLKYVTQFYTDQALNTPWSPPNWSVSTAWRGYNVLAGQDFYPQYDGTNTANVSKLGTNVLQQSYGNSDNLLPFRIWAAFFDSNGLKQRATAVPSQIRPT